MIQFGLNEEEFDVIFNGPLGGFLPIGKLVELFKILLITFVVFIDGNRFDKKFMLDFHSSLFFIPDILIVFIQHFLLIRKGNIPSNILLV